MEVVHGEVFKGMGVAKREALVELYLFERLAVSSIASEEERGRQLARSSSRVGIPTSRFSYLL